MVKARHGVTVRLFDQLFSLFGKMRAWFFTIDDNWRINSPTTIVVVMAREIESLGEDRDPTTRQIAKHLKNRIQMAALAEGVEKKLNCLIRSRVNPK